MTTATPRQINLIRNLTTDTTFPTQDEITTIAIDTILADAVEAQVGGSVFKIREQMAAEGMDINDFNDAYVERYHEIEENVRDEAQANQRANIESIAAEITAAHHKATTTDLETLTKIEARDIIGCLNSAFIQIIRGTHTEPRPMLLPSALAELNNLPLEG